MSNRITTILEFIGADSASKQIKKLGTEFQTAEGFSNKAKVAFSGAGQILKNNVAEVATVAGTALVTFGVKSVQAFTDTAIAAGKFADSTGLAVEDASRWMEVSEDVGVSAETTAGLFTRLNKAIGDGAPVVAQLGIEQKKLADGTTDVNATMVEAIRKLNEIKDPTERAAAAQKLFGKGYKEAAEIIFTSADGLVEKLGEVADAKVIDEEELEKARKFREAMDNLKDSFEEITLVVGEKLTPAVTDATNDLMTLKSATERIPGPMKDAANAARNLVDPLYAAKNAFDLFTGSSDESSVSAETLTGISNELTSAVDAAVRAGIEQADTYAVIDDRAEGVARAQENHAAATERATAEAKKNLETSKRLTDEYNEQTDAIDDLLQSKLDLVGGELAVKAAWRGALDASNELNASIADGTLEFSDLGPAINSAAQEADNAARSAAEFAAEQLRANGNIVDANTNAYLYRQALSDLAAQTTGPTHDAIMQLIAELDAIPESKTVNVQVDIAGGRFNAGGGLVITPGTRSADGNYNTPGGLQTINDGNGGEIVTLPGGSKVMTHANSLNYLNQMDGGSDDASVVYNNKTINQYIQVTGDPESVLYEAGRRARYME